MGIRVEIQDELRVTGARLPLQRLPLPSGFREDELVSVKWEKKVTSKPSR